MRAFLCGGLLLWSSSAFGQSWRPVSPKTKTSQEAKPPAASQPSTLPPGNGPTYVVPPGGVAVGAGYVPVYGGYQAYGPPPGAVPSYVPTQVDPYTSVSALPPAAMGPPLVGPTSYPTTMAPSYQIAVPAASRLPTPPETQPLPSANNRFAAAGAPLPQPAPQATPMTIDGVPPSENGLCEEDCAPKACWVLSADLMGLTRTRASDQTLVKDCVDACSVLDVHDLNFGYDLGLRVGAIRLPGGCGGCAWEIGYMGLPNWSTTDSVSGHLIFCGPGFTVEVNPANFVAHYESSLHSLEANVRPFQAAVCGAQCSWFVGFRYFRLDESFVISETIAPIPNVLNIHTQNNLFGGQMGANILMMDRGGPFYLESVVKFGLYGNAYGQTTASAVVGPAVEASDTNLAFAGEFLFAAGYRVNCHFDLRVGYQILGLSGVALAPDQMRLSDIPNDCAYLQTGQLIAHGAFLGGSFRW